VGVTALMLSCWSVAALHGRGLTFFYDDWDFVTHDYAVGPFLPAAHVGTSRSSVAVYKVSFIWWVSTTTRSSASW